MFIILDNAESILDPKETGAKEIHSVVEELCQFKKLCICITSRITTAPPPCNRPEIPTLSIKAARDIFYGTYRNANRSSVINDLLERLDFHALSIKLLATTASQNGWDHNRLSKEWEVQRARVLRADYNESLAATIELSLSSPTFSSLGPSARDLLGVVAFFPQGINQNNLNWLFPTTTNKKTIFDTFYLLSMTYRSNCFITMLAPIRDYLAPRDPRSSPLLCTTRDHYFNRLSVVVQPNKPGFEEARWIVLEDVNVEHLLDVFMSINQTSGDIWEACFHFVEHLVWHKPRPTILGSKVEALADDHPSKPKCLLRLSWLFQQVGNHLGRKRLLTHILELERRRGNEVQIARTLRYLSGANRLLGFHKEGVRLAKEALGIFERINHTEGQAASLMDLSRSLFYDNQLDAAEDAASRAIDLISGKGQEYIVSDLHRALGKIHESKGEREKAIDHFKTALGIASSFNWPDVLFWNHYNLATLFSKEDQFGDANVHVELAKSHASDNAYRLGRAMELQASVWYQQRRLEDAKSEILHALKLYEQLEATEDVGSCRGLLRKVERAMDRRLPVSSC